MDVYMGKLSLVAISQFSSDDVGLLVLAINSFSTFADVNYAVAADVYDSTILVTDEELETWEIGE